MATTQKLTSQQYFQTQTIIHLALIAGQVLFGAVTLYLRLNASETAATPELRQLLMYIVPVAAAAGVFASFQVFKWLLKKAKEKSILPQKIAAYGSAMIVRYAVLEAPSLLGIVAFYLTGDYAFLTISGLIIAFFFIIRPSKEKLIQELKLISSEETLINDPNAIIMERSYTR